MNISFKIITAILFIGITGCGDNTPSTTVSGTISCDKDSEVWSMEKDFSHIKSIEVLLTGFLIGFDFKPKQFISFVVTPSSPSVLVGSTSEENTAHIVFNKTTTGLCAQGVKFTIHGIFKE